MNKFKKYIEDSNLAKLSLLKINDQIDTAIQIISKSIQKGGTLFLCGNGGSAADAQHLAAEFIVRLRPHVNRNPFPALSLALDTSTLTACANDYSFEEIFSRSLEALSRNKNDILLAITTSGNSKNILNVLKTAKSKKIKTIGFLGNDGGHCKDFCDFSLLVEHKNTARIQEAHIFLGHYIFEMVENILIK
ncbi:GmhA Phosphoheptose isomerase [Candidatus Pelagibacterales bacterium]